MTPTFVFHDPYLLDFFGFNDRYHEKDLEDAILRELGTFLFELGNGFGFLASKLTPKASTSTSPPTSAI